MEKRTHSPYSRYRRKTSDSHQADDGAMPARKQPLSRKSMPSAQTPGRSRNALTPDNDVLEKAVASHSAEAPRNPFRILGVIFVLSLLLPVVLKIGPVYLYAYRAWLTLIFVPVFFLWIAGRGGRIIAVDWLVLGSALWAALALFLHHGGEVIEAAALYIIETTGAYLVARLAVRSAADFIYLTRILFLVMMVLLPFAIFESLTGRPILLELIPGSFGSFWMDPRWGLDRVQAVFIHPIHYGIFVGSLCGMCWFALKPNASFFQRCVRSGVPVFSTFLSLSAGAFLAVIIQGGLILWEISMRRIYKRWTIFAALCVTGYFALNLVAERSPFHTLVFRASFSVASGYNRIQIWQFGSDNVADNPFFGLGFNDWVRPEFMGSSVDNFWLLTAMRYGLPSIIMLLGAFVVMIRMTARQKLANPTDSDCRAGHLITLGGLIIAGGTVHYWDTLLVYVMFVFGMGAWALNGHIQDNGAPQTNTPSDDRGTSGIKGKKRERTHLR